MTKQGYINHVGLVLDASGSMINLRYATIKVADNQVKFLASRSTEMDQETRMTVYTFNERVENVFYDKDVLRLPSLGENYRPGGQTALIDATVQAILDLKQTATLYGDHAFLLYILTDGFENGSRRSTRYDLQNQLKGLPDNWTVAVLAPSQQSVFELKKLGFDTGNIALWDTTEIGIAEVGRKIQEATSNYMVARTQGITSTRSLFDFTKQDVQAAVSVGAIKALDKNDYAIYPVLENGVPIKEYVSRISGKDYKIGSTYYQLTKPEDIQAQKQIVIQDKRNWGAVYAGPQARAVLGLPDYQVHIRPKDHPDFDIYVQSTSVNRKLVNGTSIIVL